MLSLNTFSLIYSLSKSTQEDDATNVLTNIKILDLLQKYLARGLPQDKTNFFHDIKKLFGESVLVKVLVVPTRTGNAKKYSKLFESDGSMNAAGYITLSTFNPQIGSQVGVGFIKIDFLESIIVNKKISGRKKYILFCKNMNSNHLHKVRYSIVV